METVTETSKGTVITSTIGVHVNDTRQGMSIISVNEYTLLTAKYGDNASSIMISDVDMLEALYRKMGKEVRRLKARQKKG